MYPSMGVLWRPKYQDLGSMSRAEDVESRYADLNSDDAQIWDVIACSHWNSESSRVHSATAKLFACESLNAEISVECLVDHKAHSRASQVAIYSPTFAVPKLFHTGQLDSEGNGIRKQKRLKSNARALMNTLRLRANCQLSIPCL